MTNKIKESNITDGAVTSDKIAPGTIANDRLAGSIAISKLATDPTNASNIASGTLANARLTGSGALTINGTSIALGASGNIVAGTDWQSVVHADGSTNTTGVAGRGYFINTFSAAHTFVLPSSPSVGDEIEIKDYNRTFHTNNVTIDRNGSNLDGVALNTTLEIQGQAVKFVYMDATKGWSLVNSDTTISIGATYTSATGGTVSTSGDYKIHLFNSTSNFVVSSVGNAEGGKCSYAVVAGGGGGGQCRAGGGGAGGFREGKTTDDTYSASPIVAPDGLALSVQTYPISVGGGGSGAGCRAHHGSPGTTSSFSTITSAGGGGAASDGSPTTGESGGSAGGGANSGPGGTGNTPPVSPPQGNNGGNSIIGSSGGGGGGATAVGGNMPNPTTAGTGGAGATTSISGSPVARAGGGGGGSSGSGAPGGTGGGAGGQGGGNPTAQGASGTANTGGGGGGSSEPGSGGGGSGGSGVVILRYKYQN
jgi:hypothetical protein